MKKYFFALTLVMSLISTAQALEATYDSDPNIGGSRAKTGISVSSISIITFSPTIGTVMTTAEVSGKNHKLILAAKEDAATFIGSDGEILGAYFEAAIQSLHSQIPNLVSSDFDLAIEILNY